MFSVTNNTAHTKLVRPRRGSLVTVRPKETKKIDMDPRTAAYHRKLHLRQQAVDPNKGTLEISAIEDDDQRMLDAVQAGTRPVEDQSQASRMKAASGQEDSLGSGDPPAAGKRTASLLARVDEISFPQFRSEAREILGERYPAGNPNKADLVALLSGTA